MTLTACVSLECTDSLVLRDLDREDCHIPMNLRKRPAVDPILPLRSPKSPRKFTPDSYKSLGTKWMNSRKRPAADLLLPLRSPKSPRTFTPDSYKLLRTKWYNLGGQLFHVTCDTIWSLLYGAYNPQPSPLFSPESPPQRVRYPRTRQPANYPARASTRPENSDHDMHPHSHNKSTSTDLRSQHPTTGAPPSTKSCSPPDPSSSNAPLPRKKSSLYNARPPVPVDFLGLSLEGSRAQGTRALPSPALKPIFAMSPPKAIFINHRLPLNSGDPAQTNVAWPTSLAPQEEPPFRFKYRGVEPATAESELPEKQEPLKLNRPYRNRKHIHLKEHKEEVKLRKQKDRKESVKQLFEAHRLSGYLNYQAQLDQMERQDSRRRRTPPLTTPLTNVKEEPSSRPKSFSEDLKSDFLERALKKARESLNGPKPPKPYMPGIDQLRGAELAQDKEIERRLHPKYPTALAPAEEAQVKVILNRSGVVARFSREHVNSDDVSRLKPAQWLNDEVVNFYGAMIQGRADEAKENSKVNGSMSGKGSKRLDIHYFSTFFWQKLCKEGYKQGRLFKWTKKLDIFTKDVILIPINHNNAHWSVASINFRRKRIESYDSMNMDARRIFKELRAYLDTEHRNKHNTPFDFTGWEDYTSDDAPQQENNYDCGVFTCQFLEALSRGEESFDFVQRNMPYLRRHMILEISNSRLRPRN